MQQHGTTQYHYGAVSTSLTVATRSNVDAVVKMRLLCSQPGVVYVCGVGDESVSGQTTASGKQLWMKPGTHALLWQSTGKVHVNGKVHSFAAWGAVR